MKIRIPTLFVGLALGGALLLSTVGVVAAVTPRVGPAGNGVCAPQAAAMKTGATVETARAFGDCEINRRFTTLDTLAAKAFTMPPCPTRGGDQDVRMAYLETLYRRSGAAGIVVHVQKFCEPELFDVPAIRRRFARIGAPLLYLEGELEASLSGQVITRLEAFVEMVDAGRKAP